MAKRVVPAQVGELSLSVAKMQVATGTVGEGEANMISQSTVQENLASLDTYLGTDFVKKGTTVDNIKRIYDTAYREQTQAQKTLSADVAGKGTAATTANKAPVRVTSKAQYDALSNGTYFIDDSGKVKIKGQK
jgi:hypothetical protein